MNIVLLGAAGAGKGTQAAKLVEAYGLTHISTGDIFRKNVAEGTELASRPSATWMQAQLVPDAVVIAHGQGPTVPARLRRRLHPRRLSSHASSGRGAQTRRWTRWASSSTRSSRSRSPRDVLMGRLTSRRQCRGCGRIYNVMGEMPARDGVCDSCGGEVYQRDDDTVEAATQPPRTTTTRSPLSSCRTTRARACLHEIDGDRPVDVVFADVRAALEA